MITYAFTALFLAMIVYFAYFMIFQSETVINNSYNKRTDLLSETVLRGSITASDGTVLAYSVENEDGSITRIYPYGRMYAHAVGYSINGRTGIESQANFYMLRSHAFFLSVLKNQFSNERSAGDTVVTTLDHELQTLAYEGLGDYDGAVIAIEPSTGKILCMVSKPDFDPNSIGDIWEEITAEDSESTVLLNRVTQGLYPPGSTFKLLTAAAYLKQHNLDDSQFHFLCEGSFSEDEYTVTCAHDSVHGEEDLTAAVQNSCNCAFASIGLELDMDLYGQVCTEALFNTSLPGAYGATQSQFVLNGDSGTFEIMQTAFGQGSTLVTPYHMALITCAIANDGVLMTPYALDHVESVDGSVIRRFSSTVYGNLFDAETAKKLQEYMRAVVDGGGASALYDRDYTAYGKTGTAEITTGSDETHAWFVGYAEKEGYEDLVVVVLVERAGGGATYALPIAQDIFDAYFHRD